MVKLRQLSYSKKARIIAIIQKANITRINRGYYRMKNVKDSPDYILYLNIFLLGHLISIN